VQRQFQIDLRNSSGNLHIQLRGEFDGMCAWELIKTIRQHGKTAGRIFVSVIGLTRVIPAGVELFKGHMKSRELPPDWLYFKGDKGFDIAPDRSRVIICKKLDRSRKTRCHKPKFSPHLVGI
jgi:hypothetical protein